MQGDRMMKVLPVFVGSGLWALALRGGAPAHAAGGQEADVLRARRVEVVDAAGHARVVVSADKDGPRVDLCDADGRRRITQTIGYIGPSVELYDADGKVRLRQAVWSIGPYAAPIAEICDADGKKAIRQVVDDDGARVNLSDADGKIRLSHAVRKDGPSVTLNDAAALYVHSGSNRFPTPNAGCTSRDDAFPCLKNRLAS